MRRIAKYIVTVILVFVVAFFVVWITSKYNEKKEAGTRIQILPDVAFISLNGDSVNLHDFDQTQPLVLGYFHPECEHCQYEAKEMGIHAPQFSGTNVLMITPCQSIQQLNNFATEYNLWALDNFEILLDRNNTFKTYFGTKIIPSFFIYKNRKLVKKYPGETKIEAILKAID